MADPTPAGPRHGTRACYQAGCRAVQCKAAEAHYRAALRRLRAHGKYPLRADIPAAELWKMIKALRTEGLSYAQIAMRLGLHSPKLQFHTDRVTLLSYLKVRKLYRHLMAEGPDEPLDAPGEALKS